MIAFENCQSSYESIFRLESTLGWTYVTNLICGLVSLLVGCMCY